MQLKDIARGLREAATMLPSDPRQAPGFKGIEELVYESEFKACYDADDFYAAFEGEPLTVRIGGCTYRFPTPCRERLERAAATALRHNMDNYGTAAHTFSEDRKDKISTGRRPPQSVLKDFIVDGELENAAQYSELTGSQSMLAELLKP